MIVVTGLGRCGSSLVMQMLAAGGFRTIGEWPAYEDENCLYPSRKWWDHLPHLCAVKVIDPHRFTVMRSSGASAIQLSRCFEQQARSQVKFLSSAVKLSSSSEKEAWRVIARSLELESREAARAVGRFCRKKLELRFETLISEPLDSAKLIATYVQTTHGVELEVEKMAGCVRNRPTDCLSYLLEQRMLEERPPEWSKRGGR